MEYFEILGLKKEPFSNSPEPELFYLSDQHWGCLQKLELAIRLRRGLNVVMGDVGAGKTTLCRQLIIKLESFQEGPQRFETHLILDPDFSSPCEFIRTVARELGIIIKDENTTGWQLKEEIKKYLFKKGIEENKIIVLIIDEGQKLPSFALETLREFLNYETNEYKLLQIIIFAQNEFRATMQEHANFIDRVNQFIDLKPLNFQETRNLIRFRLAQSSNDGPPHLFSFFAYKEIWRATGGYPRKVINLCHQIVLALIIQNKMKAGRSLVRACAQRVPHNGAKRRYLLPALTIIILLSAFIIIYNLTSFQEYPAKILSSLPPGEDKQAPPKQADNILLEPEKADISEPKTMALPVEQTTGSAVTQNQPPSELGSITVRKGDALSIILESVYGRLSSDQMQVFIRSNPHVTNVNLIKIGGNIKLPVIISSTRPPDDKSFWVEVKTCPTLEELYRQFRGYPSQLPAVRLFPYWNSQRGMVYALVLRETYYDARTAKKDMDKLPSPMAREARVIDKWDADTVFFTNF